jgi:hypothetical protein
MILPKNPNAWSRATVIRVLFEAGILTAHYVEERRMEVTS